MTPTYGCIRLLTMRFQSDIQDVLRNGQITVREREAVEQVEKAIGTFLGATE